MSYCQNCGNESHCGASLYKDMTDGDNNIINIEVCKQCRCEVCQKKDTDNG